MKCLSPLGLLLLLASPGSAQVPERTLPKPSAELEESFSAIISIRELPDGRVLVVDSGERTVFLADLGRGGGGGSGTLQKVSREGAGPLEYRLPMLLLPRGDSTYLLDAMLQRFLIFNAAGAPVKTRRIIETQDPAAMFRATTIRAVDAQGRWYSQVMPMRLDTTSGQMQVGGSGLLVRWSAESPRADTLAQLATPGQTSRISGKPGTGMRISVPIVPPEIVDAWDLLPNGAVAVARGADYHVDYIRPDGKTSAGPRVPHAVHPLTAADQDRIRREARTIYEQSMKRGMAMAGDQAPKITLDVEDPKQWPKVFPPFSMVRASPDGRLWVAPAPRGPAVAQVWDVLGSDGVLAMRVRFPPRVSLIGFGKNVLYAVRVDEDDLQYLQRYSLP